MDFKTDTPVKLKTFRGLLSRPENVDDQENYWKLIGLTGRIIDSQELSEGRILVLFDQKLDDFNVENHNPIQNSLWISKSDLEIISL